LIDDNYIDIDRQQINFIKDLIAGVPKSTRWEKSYWKHTVDNLSAYTASAKRTIEHSCLILLRTSATAWMWINSTTLRGTATIWVQSHLMTQSDWCGFLVS
jgi:hypothetical protein